MKNKQTQPQPAATTRSPEAFGVEPDLTGKTLGDFHILRRLGQGGMGQVYLAEQISLKRKVALKTLNAELAANAVSLERFKREAEAIAQATHANIVQVYAFNEVNGQHFMALEYVEGRNLREYLEKKGPPEILVALSIMRQVAAALQRAHELGIIHRDIKPENILLTRKGEAKVSDFGLSRLADNSQHSQLTQSGVSLGTPLYMSPEQVECKTIDHRTDIYSFGVTCYHLLAGQTPFRGESPFEVAIQHVQNEAPRLADIRPDLPADLCTLVHRMLAKKPAERVQTGREIVKELVRLRDSLVGVTTTPAIRMGPGPPLPGDTAATQVLPPMKTWHGWRWLVAGSIVLALAGGFLAGWLRHRRAPAPDLPVEAAVTKPPTSANLRETRLKKLVEDSMHPEGQPQIRAGLQHAIDLGLFYLKDRRLDEAEQFFKELGKPSQKIAPYHTWGELGQAIVLAFRDKPAESNEQFTKVLKWDKAEKAGRYLVMNTPAVRAIIAEALNHNHENAPGSLSPRLEFFRSPPRPKAKAAS